ncbi:hypothetical protein ACHAP8_009432 [Fusarium lateritium]
MEEIPSIDRLSSEIIDLIFGQLFDATLRNQHKLNDDGLAAWTAYDDLPIWGVDTELHDCRWNNLMDLQVVKHYAKRVIIETCPLNAHNFRSNYTTLRDLHWSAFLSDLNRIIEVDRLQAIEVHFCNSCIFGDLLNQRANISTKGAGILDASLNAIYKAIMQREERLLQDGMTGISPIRELKLKNFRTNHPPEALTKGLLKNIQRLHIRFLEGVDKIPQDFHRQVRINFEHTLERALLVPVMDQLVELTLFSQWDWGTFPSRFKGKGLVFPNLKTLRLSYFTIGHYDQFDWILNQKTLTCLLLRGCAIITHFVFLENRIHNWNVDTSDWKRIVSPYIDADKDYFTFDLKWKTLFDNIREGLPKLTKFGLIMSLPEKDLFRNLCRPLTIGNRTDLSKSQDYTDFGIDEAAAVKDETDWFMLQGYTAFDMSLWHWPLHHGAYGRSFYHNRDCFEGDWDYGDAAKAVDAAHAADVRALNALIQATFERRGD